MARARALVTALALPADPTLALVPALALALALPAVPTYAVVPKAESVWWPETGRRMCAKSRDGSIMSLSMPGRNPVRRALCAGRTRHVRKKNSGRSGRHLVRRPLCGGADVRGRLGFELEDVHRLRVGRHTEHVAGVVKAQRRHRGRLGSSPQLIEEGPVRGAKHADDRALNVRSSARRGRRRQAQRRPASLPFHVLSKPCPRPWPAASRKS